MLVGLNKMYVEWMCVCASRQGSRDEDALCTYAGMLMGLGMSGMFLKLCTKQAEIQ